MLAAIKHGQNVHLVADHVGYSAATSQAVAA